MSSEQTSAPLTALIAPHLPIVEKILLVSVVVGIIMMVMEIDSGVAGFSFYGLAITFFLTAFRPTEVPLHEDGTRVGAVGAPIREGEAGGFSELFGLMILPKVLWISSAVSAIGIGSYILDFGNEGYRQMLMIGGSTIAIGLLLFVGLMVNGMRHASAVRPILLRAAPIAIVAFYILIK